MKKPVEMKKKKYTLQVNYSPKAIEKKLMKFITPSGDEFEISAEEMSSILVGQVNSELLEATFVESDRVNVVEVTRQIRVLVNKDIKKGEEVRLEYKHPYPVEFAVIEQAMKLAKINMDVPAFTLTKEYLDKVMKKTTPEQKKFIQKFYEFFKNLLKSKNP
jgi:glucosamine 6-phosphate synthetase-like amidotransferase/phosphosugar isomerase protein